MRSINRQCDQNWKSVKCHRFDCDLYDLVILSNNFTQYMEPFNLSLQTANVSNVSEVIVYVSLAKH